MISEQLNKVAFLLNSGIRDRWAVYRVGFDTESEAVWDLTNPAAKELIAILKQYPSFFEVEPELFVNLPKIVAINRLRERRDKFGIFFNNYLRDGREPIGKISHCVILPEAETRRIMAAHEFLRTTQSGEEDIATAN